MEGEQESNRAAQRKEEDISPYCQEYFLRCFWLDDVDYVGAISLNYLSDENKLCFLYL